jgi:hypothetical protein
MGSYYREELPQTIDANVCENKKVRIGTKSQMDRGLYYLEKRIGINL